MSQHIGQPTRSRSSIWIEHRISNPSSLSALRKHFDLNSQNSKFPIGLSTRTVRGASAWESCAGSDTRLGGVKKGCTLAAHAKFAHAIPSSPMAAMGCPPLLSFVAGAGVFTSGGSL